jgi:hypothetical protein
LSYGAWSVARSGHIRSRTSGRDAATKTWATFGPGGNVRKVCTQIRTPIRRLRHRKLPRNGLGCGIPAHNGTYCAAGDVRTPAYSGTHCAMALLVCGFVLARFAQFPPVCASRHFCGRCPALQERKGRDCTRPEPKKPPPSWTHPLPAPETLTPLGVGTSAAARQGSPSRSF